MRSDPAPQIEIVGELSDLAIEALAALLIELAEADSAGTPEPKPRTRRQPVESFF